uniref:CinA-like protein n=2 Tax=Zeugodacus cucurbitae TaxID=28588 RepID=A0A0A1XQQ1_ZEUCU
MPTILNIYLALTVIGLFLTNAVKSEIRPEVAELQVDTTRNEYIALQQSLWRYLNKEGTSKSSQLRKVYDSHRTFISDHFQSNFEVGRYDILNHYEWSLLERDLLQIDRMFDYYQNYLNEHNNSAEVNERAILDICETVLRNDNVFSMSRIFQDVELVMVKQTLYYRAMLESMDQICHTQQSAQQFVFSLYSDIALTELKGYTMMQFSWMMLRIYGKGNFSQEVELMHMDYAKRTERTLKLLREVMRRADRILWRCDPGKFEHGKNYDEVTRLLQGYIENEVDLNKEETCRETCDFYQSTRSEGCFKDLYCARQPRCSGKLYHCTYVDADMWVCPASRNSTRRYEYIEYENGRVLGQKSACVRGTTKVDSWWRYLFWHCSYCFCLCDEISIKSDRYFNLRETVADVENNRVVAGLRMTKHNRIFHLQIQEGELLPRGNINRSSLTWKPVESYQIFDRDVRNGRDYHTLSYESRSMDLDDIYTDDNSFIVVGVRWRVVGAHLNLEAKLAEFDFKMGKLISPETNSFWKSNDNTDVSGERRQKINLINPDKSTRTIVKSIPDSRHNQYIDFINTSMEKDAAQSTVPFIDTQEVTSNPPVPLSGVGIYHKGRQGYGGFLAPKIMTYDFAPHIRVPQDIN